MQNAARSLALFLRDGHTYNFNDVLQFFCHRFSKPLPTKGSQKLVQLWPTEQAETESPWIHRYQQRRGIVGDTTGQSQKSVEIML